MEVCVTSVPGCTIPWHRLYPGLNRARLDYIPGTLCSRPVHSPGVVWCRGILRPVTPVLTNRKSHIGFRLLPKAVTLNDLAWCFSTRSDRFWSHPSSYHVKLLWGSLILSARQGWSDSRTLSVCVIHDARLCTNIHLRACCKPALLSVCLSQWFLTWGPGTPWGGGPKRQSWGSQTRFEDIIDCKQQQQSHWISSDESNMKSIRY